MSKKKTLTKAEFINRYLNDQLQKKTLEGEKLQKTKFAKDYTKRKNEEKSKRRKGNIIIISLFILQSLIIREVFVARVIIG